MTERAPEPTLGDPNVPVLPLTGIKVLDLSRLLPGPMASLVLADLGAQVDKVEDPTAGDYLRLAPPFFSPSSTGAGAPPTSSTFLALNRNKRSAAVDLKAPGAKEAILRLVRRYDVVLEQFRPGVLARLGLGHDVLLAENPGLVVCALTGYGQTGPLRERAGHDLNYLARAGVLGFQGPPDAPPVVPGFQLADMSGGLFAVIGILSALVERTRSGKGKVIDVAMIETAMPFALSGYSLLFAGQAVARGAETLTGGIAPYGTYATKDGEAMALAALEPKFWAAFSAAVGRPIDPSDLVPGPHQDTLRAELSALFATKTRDDWAALASQHDFCLEPVLTPEEASHDPHLAARGMFFDLDSPWGTLRQLRTPLAPPRAHTPPPRLGEHTEAVFRDAGFTDEEIAALRASCAIV